MKKIFYIIGKSTTGKDHFYEDILAQEELALVPLVMYTTRPMREGEEEGCEYHFVSEEKYEEYRAGNRIIEERTYQTVHGPWHYFTVDDGSLDLEHNNYLAIGTLESYGGVRAHFGEDRLVPLYIEVRDDIRLIRTIERERKQEQPNYAEICRRFLADDADFAEEKIREAGITRRFENNGEYADCLQELLQYIRTVI